MPPIDVRLFHVSGDADVIETFSLSLLEAHGAVLRAARAAAKRKCLYDP